MPKPHDARTAYSKALSLLLRHNAVKDGVSITHDGWVSVNDAVGWVNRRHRGLTEQDVPGLVADCAKQRFSMRVRDGRSEIRANQGHTMPEVAVDMAELSATTAPRLAVHGTYHRAWESIRTDGLSKMTRQHVLP